MNPQIGSISIELSARVKGSGPSVVMGTVQVPLMVKNMAANRLEIDINPMMEYVAESFKAVFADPPEPRLSDEGEMHAAWQTYREETGRTGSTAARGLCYELFAAGWKAARR